MNETRKDNGPQERAAILQDAQPAPDQSSRNYGGSLTRPTRAARPSPPLSLGNLSTSPRAATCEQSKNALIDSTAHLDKPPSPYRSRSHSGKLCFDVGGFQVAACVATAKKRSLLVHGSPANIAEPRSFQLDARKTDPKLELMRQRDSLAFMKHNHTSQETTTTATRQNNRAQICAR